MQTKPQPGSTPRDDSTTTLEEFLRAELSAVETYELALAKIEDVGMHHALQEILTSHARRADAIRESLSLRGQKPPPSSGVWGAFAKLVQAGADALGTCMAIDALEAGEDRGIKLYSTGLDHCDAKTRRFLGELIPEQQHTHEICRNLKRFVHTPS